MACNGRNPQRVLTYQRSTLPANTGQGRPIFKLSASRAPIKMLPDYNVPLFASDDIDFTHLISPARAVHRRTRSDPTEIDFASLRADVAADRSKGPSNLTTEVPLGGSPVRMRPPAAASILLQT